MLIIGLPLTIVGGTLVAFLLCPSLLFWEAALLAALLAPTDASDWVSFALLQLTLGPATGVAVGYLGARLLDSSAERAWAIEPFKGIAILSLAIFTYVAAELIGGNGFIAAFIGGMVFGKTVRHPVYFPVQVHGN